MPRSWHSIETGLPGSAPNMWRRLSRHPAAGYWWSIQPRWTTTWSGTGSRVIHVVPVTSSVSPGLPAPATTSVSKIVAAMRANPGGHRQSGGGILTTTGSDITRYTYRVTWSVEDDEFVATCVEFPSLSWLADTQEGALRGLRDLVAEVVDDLHDNGEPVPEPLSSRVYSGEFNLRVGERLHRKLAVEAAEENLSLNQYIIRRLTNAS